MPDSGPGGLPGVDATLGRAGGENFTVASRLLPRRVRSELLDIYGYARLVDEIGDSYEGDRLSALARVETSLRGATAGREDGAHPLVVRAARLVRAGKVSEAPLIDLIEANRMDQTVSAYETVVDLYRYCSLSANPVGRLVLQVFGVLDDERAAWSDSICTGLQLVEHWQDVREDALAGRVYLPLEDLSRFEVKAEELALSGPASPALCALMSFECGRARTLLRDGAPLIASLRGRLKFAVAGFAAGGHAALDALEAQGFDPLGGAVRPSPSRVARHTFALMFPRRRRGDLR